MDKLIFLLRTITLNEETKLIEFESFKKKLINSRLPNFYIYLMWFVVWLLIDSISNIHPIHTKHFVTNFDTFKNSANNAPPNSRNTDRKLYILRAWE